MANSATSCFYSFILYYEDWDTEQVVDCCNKSCLPCYISPLHNRDTFTTNDYLQFLWENNKELFKVCKIKGGNCLETIQAKLLECDMLDQLVVPEWVPDDPKKPHWHILIQFQKRIGISNALQLVKSYFPFFDIHYLKITDPQYACLYWSHLNAPYKAQYDTSKAIACNGFVPDLSLPDGFKPQHYILFDIMSYINGSASRCSLASLIYHYKGQDDYVEYIRKNSFLISKLVDERMFNL